MTQVNIHEAKTHLSRLVDRAAAGETVIIAKAGKPRVQMTALPAEEPAPTKSRIGFMKGEGRFPDDIKTPFAAEIEEMFYGPK